MKGSSKKQLLRTIASGTATVESVKAHTAARPDLSDLTDEELRFLHHCKVQANESGYTSLDAGQIARLEVIQTMIKW